MAQAVQRDLEHVLGLARCGGRDLGDPADIAKKAKKIVGKKLLRPPLRGERDLAVERDRRAARDPDPALERQAA
ncbi:MAG: hypothetical protein ABI355_18610 [Solirubrobacteraceae bacterium]